MRMMFDASADFQTVTIDPPYKVLGSFLYDNVQDMWSALYDNVQDMWSADQFIKWLENPGGDPKTYELTFGGNAGGSSITVTRSPLATTTPVMSRSAYRPTK